MSVSERLELTRIRRPLRNEVRVFKIVTRSITKTSRVPVGDFLVVTESRCVAASANLRRTTIRQTFRLHDRSIRTLTEVRAIATRGISMRMLC